MNTILVPTDFSKDADHALKYALSIAKAHKAKIILMHAYHASLLPETPVTDYRILRISVKTEVEKRLANSLKNTIGRSKIEAECLSEEGLLGDVVPELVRKKKIDLVVMGTKGAGGIREKLIGSMTATVITRTSCPVIAVPGKAELKPVKHITFATDFYEADIRSLRQLVSFAEIHKATIQVVHVQHPVFADESKLLNAFERNARKRIDYRDISFRMIPGTDPEKSLLKYLKAGDSDMLAITSVEKTWIERIFFKSVAKKLIYHTRIPLMVFHAK